MLKKVRIEANGEEIGIVATVEFNVTTGKTSGFDHEHAADMIETRIDTLMRELSDMSGVPIQHVKLKGMSLMSSRDA